jgi:SAM-dependent methyltransferase
VAEANEEQRAYWNEKAGPVWVAFQERLDAQIRPHGELAMAALAPAAGERVLDVGCGCGQTVLTLAERVGPAGAVVGVDLSEPMLARARERLAASGLSHATLRSADAQRSDLGSAAFDGVFSRFGVMFFEDPVAAFANLRAALRPGGRLAFVCWRSPQENPWLTRPMAAAAPFLELPGPPPDGVPGMFAFADGARLRQILVASGFSDVVVEGHEPQIVPGGGSVDEAVETFLSIGPVGGALREAGADASTRARVADAVRRVYEEALQGGSLRMASAVWVVRARRPGA